jgi:hypothetical protein
MKRYLDHIKSKPTHERRQHAMQMSAAILVLVFLVWISTLGLRFASPAQTADANDGTQTASVVQASSGNATLMVATSTNAF